MLRRWMASPCIQHFQRQNVSK